MVEILCPHCDDEIELDDDSSGVFACPYCDGEFEWGPQRDAFGETIRSFLGFFFITTLVFFCLSFSLFFFDGYQLDEALGWTLFLAIIAPVWIPLAFVPFFIHRGYLFIQRLREAS